MRKVQEVLRLLLVCGLSRRQVSRASGVGRASVAEYVERTQKAGLLETWESLSEEEFRPPDIEGARIVRFPVSGAPRWHSGGEVGFPGSGPLRG
jgi:hypothetical protein